MGQFDRIRDINGRNLRLNERTVYQDCRVLHTKHETNLKIRSLRRRGAFTGLAGKVGLHIYLNSLFSEGQEV